MSKLLIIPMLAAFISIAGFTRDANSQVTVTLPEPINVFGEDKGVVNDEPFRIVLDRNNEKYEQTEQEKYEQEKYEQEKYRRQNERYDGPGYEYDGPGYEYNNQRYYEPGYDPECGCGKEKQDNGLHKGWYKEKHKNAKHRNR